MSAKHQGNQKKLLNIKEKSSRILFKTSAFNKKQKLIESDSEDEENHQDKRQNDNECSQFNNDDENNEDVVNQEDQDNAETIDNEEQEEEESLSEDEYIVEAIRGHKNKGKNRQYFIKWEGYPESQNTWEPRENLLNIKDMLREYEGKIRAAANKSESSDEESPISSVHKKNLASFSSSSLSSSSSKNRLSSKSQKNKKKELIPLLEIENDSLSLLKLRSKEKFGSNISKDPRIQNNSSKEKQINSLKIPDENQNQQNKILSSRDSLQNKYNSPSKSQILDPFPQKKQKLNSQFQNTLSIPSSTSSISNINSHLPLPFNQEKNPFLRYGLLETLSSQLKNNQLESENNQRVNQSQTREIFSQPNLLSKLVQNSNYESWKQYDAQQPKSKNQQIEQNNQQESRFSHLQDAIQQSQKKIDSLYEQQQQRQQQKQQMQQYQQQSQSTNESILLNQQALQSGNDQDLNFNLQVIGQHKNSSLSKFCEENQACQNKENEFQNSDQGKENNQNNFNKPKQLEKGKLDDKGKQTEIVKFQNAQIRDGLFSSLAVLSKPTSGLKDVIVSMKKNLPDQTLKLPNKLSKMLAVEEEITEVEKKQKEELSQIKIENKQFLAILKKDQEKYKIEFRKERNLLTMEEDDYDSDYETTNKRNLFDLQLDYTKYKSFSIEQILEEKNQIKSQMIEQQYYNLKKQSRLEKDLMSLQESLWKYQELINCMQGSNQNKNSQIDDNSQSQQSFQERSFQSTLESQNDTIQEIENNNNFQTPHEPNQIQDIIQNNIQIEIEDDLSLDNQEVFKHQFIQEQNFFLSTQRQSSTIHPQKISSGPTVSVANETCDEEEIITSGNNKNQVNCLTNIYQKNFNSKDQVPCLTNVNNSGHFEKTNQNANKTQSSKNINETRENLKFIREEQIISSKNILSIIPSTNKLKEVFSHQSQSFSQVQTNGQCVKEDLCKLSTIQENMNINSSTPILQSRNQIEQDKPLNKIIVTEKNNNNTISINTQFIAHQQASDYEQQKQYLSSNLESKFFNLRDPLCNFPPGNQIPFPNKQKKDFTFENQNQQSTISEKVFSQEKQIPLNSSSSSKDKQLQNPTLPHQQLQSIHPKEQQFSKEKRISKFSLPPQDYLINSHSFATSNQKDNIQKSKHQEKNHTKEEQDKNRQNNSKKMADSISDQANTFRKNYQSRSDEYRISKEKESRFSRQSRYSSSESSSSSNRKKDKHKLKKSKDQKKKKEKRDHSRTSHRKHENRDRKTSAKERSRSIEQRRRNHHSSQSSSSNSRYSPSPINKAQSKEITKTNQNDKKGTFLKGDESIKQQTNYSSSQISRQEPIQKTPPPPVSKLAPFNPFMKITQYDESDSGNECKDGLESISSPIKQQKQVQKEPVQKTIQRKISEEDIWDSCGDEDNNSSTRQQQNLEQFYHPFQEEFTNSQNFFNFQNNNQFGNTYNLNSQHQIVPQQEDKTLKKDDSIESSTRNSSCESIQKVEQIIKDPRLRKKASSLEQNKLEIKEQISKSKTLAVNLISQSDQKVNMIIEKLSELGCTLFDTPDKISSHIYSKGQIFFKIIWKPREKNLVQMRPSFIEYQKVQKKYPTLLNQYLVSTLSKNMIKI